ncbi:hypothetical protein SISNIDRAFT_320366 [Sistotremastrum niveocremeum HHB9708]|uniref:Uncharacterized protein n=1 Tax=Sistotremastrum niveocremeum HHB9708 TaxID=1314777 RepID=A0A164MZ66_9AGAM|nr:hypothetical protein SISNIDRAFT_320366 [Sistotremastrum niveocremeum HHB9708]
MYWVAESECPKGSKILRVFGRMSLSQGRIQPDIRTESPGSPNICACVVYVTVFWLKKMTYSYRRRIIDSDRAHHGNSLCLKKTNVAKIIRVLCSFESSCQFVICFSFLSQCQSRGLRTGFAPMTEWQSAQLIKQDKTSTC